MEPCQFCGQLAAVDGAGFCTNCRNYRGVPAQQPGYPTGPAYPTSAPSYGGQVSSPPYGPVSGGPVSGTPATGYPTSYPPAQPAGYQAAPPTSYPPAPATGYPPPGYPQAAMPVSAPGMPVSAPAGYPGMPPAPQKQRNPFLVPIIAVCSVLALLAVSIVVVVLVRQGGSKDKQNPPAANGFDQCLVGKWEVTDYTTQISFDSVGEVYFIADDLNETLDIKADGSATDDYGTESKPTVLIGTGGSHTYKISVSGTVTYKMASANGTLTFSDAVPDGKIALEIDGVDSGTTDLGINNDPTPYTCGGDTFTQETSDFSATASKTN